MIENLKWIFWVFLLVTLVYNLWNLQGISTKQKSVKWVLNLLLLVVVGLFLFQPKQNISNTKNTILVYSEGTSQVLINQISENLNIKKAVSAKVFEKNITTYNNHNLVILGEDLAPEIVSNWAGKEVKWYTESPNFEWDGLLRLGDAQSIKGEIYVELPERLKLVYENIVLDSVQLNKGFNAVNLSFNTFALGRNRVDLYLGNKKMEPFHFFVTTPNKFPIEIYSEYPDFELKNLGEWLGLEGYSLQTHTQVAQSSVHRSEVNGIKNQKPELLITSTDNISKERLKKHFSEGKSIFILNLTNVEPEIALINKNLGTQFSVKRISSDQEILHQKEVFGHPYQWNISAKQKLVKDLPIIKERNVAVSLLKETFPLKLSGDSLSYRQLWLSTLAAISPVDSNKIIINAPIYKNALSKVDLYSTLSSSVKLDEEVVQGEISGVNPLHKTIFYIFEKKGWVTLNDSLEVYVEDENNKAFLKEFLKTNRVKDNLSSKTNPIFTDKVWLLLLVLILALLWLEPKYTY